jgi:hypothetical protein
MRRAQYLDETNSWSIGGVRNAETFFRAVASLVPDATHLFLEGSPAPGVCALIESFRDEVEFIPPRGTLWSWPRRNGRFALRVEPELLELMADAARRHAEPEICSHLHFYCHAEPLLQWFDAFDDPMYVSRTRDFECVERFCRKVDGQWTGQPT